jgi:hypothetical protein
VQIAMRALARMSAAVRAAALRCACACAPRVTSTSRVLPPALAIAMTTLADAQAGVRRAAIAVLERDESVPTLSPDAAASLMRALMRALRRDSDDAVRIGAARCMARLVRAHTSITIDKRPLLDLAFVKVCTQSCSRVSSRSQLSDAACNDVAPSVRARVFELLGMRDAVCVLSVMMHR